MAHNFIIFLGIKTGFRVFFLLKQPIFSHFSDYANFVEWIVSLFVFFAASRRSIFSSWSSQKLGDNDRQKSSQLENFPLNLCSGKNKTKKIANCWNFFPVYFFPQVKKWRNNAKQKKQNGDKFGREWKNIGLAL